MTKSRSRNAANKEPIEAHQQQTRLEVDAPAKRISGETCDEQLPRLITNVRTAAVAATQDVAGTALIQTSLADKNLLPVRHFVDAGYVDAELLIESAEKHGVELFGPTRLNPSWQARANGFDSSKFEVDWERQTAVCPMGETSSYRHEFQSKEYYSRPLVKVRFTAADCLTCVNRVKCVRGKSASRSLQLPRRDYYEALKTSREKLSGEDGKREYKRRAGIEGTLWQAVRRGTLRRSRCRGLQKTHLQQAATAAAGSNVLRTVNYLNQAPTAKTRVSRLAGLAR